MTDTRNNGGPAAEADLQAEIQRLRIENEDMREALRPFAARAGFANSHQVVSLAACKRAYAARGVPNRDFFLVGGLTTRSSSKEA